MKLRRVTLQGFRGYQTAQTIDIDDFTVILGRNDVGKSSILEALEIFFNNATVKIDKADKCVHSGENFAEITCEFTDYPDPLVIDSSADTSLAEEFLLSISDGVPVLKIKKRYTFGSSKPKEETFVVANHPSAKGVDDLLELTNKELKDRVRQLGLEDKASLAVNASMRAAIRDAHGDLALEPRDVPVQSGDIKGIWDRLSMYLPVFALFQADRPSTDTDEEVQNPMSLAIKSALSDQQVRVHLQEVMEAVKARATDLANATHRALREIDPGLAAALTPEFSSDPKWEKLFSIKLEDQNGISLNKRGSGTRRLILVSFFKAEAERKLREGEGNNIIYAIEEPETSQHPRNQSVLLESFQEIASVEGSQVILTTHSPGLASKVPVESLRYIRRSTRGYPEVASNEESTWDEAASELGLVPDSRVRVFFCVEGPNDILAWEHISRILHEHDSSLPCLSANPGVALVLLGGSTLGHWVDQHLLRDLRRPEVHIYDRDVSKYQVCVDRVNARGDGSWATLLCKQELENYLHPAAIEEALSVSIHVDDQNDIPALVSQAKKMSASKAKKALAEKAFAKMTAERIFERDPEGELVSYLKRLGEMIES